MVSTEQNTSSEKEQRPIEAWTATGLPTLVSQVPQRPGITHLLLFTSLFVPLVFLPYIPLRRHMWQQTRQIDALRAQLGNHLSVTKENSQKLAATIRENQVLVREMQGLRTELQRINGGLEGLRSENKEKEVRDLTQSRWNEEILGAIEKIQKDNRSLTPETFTQLSEALAHLAAFVEQEERRNGLNNGIEGESPSVGVLRTLAMKLLYSSGIEHTSEEFVGVKEAKKVPQRETTDNTMYRHFM